MVKFKIAGETKTLLGFGLSAENLKRLKEGKPIVADLTEMGLPNVEIMLVYGETEAKIAESLAPYIDSNTKLHDDSSL